MLTRMEVYTIGVDAPTLPLSADGIEGDSIQIRDITGLEPVKATINTTPFSSIDGETHNGNNVGKRNIVLTVGFNPDWSTQSVDSLRDFLYSYFMPKTNVSFRFFDTIRPPCEISGWVESCNPVLFSKDPEMQISIICPQPYFVSSESIVVEGEVKIGSDVPNGVVDFTLGTEIVYEGSVPSGFKLTIGPSETEPTYDDILIIAIEGSPPRFIQFHGSISATDDILYSSIVGQKHLQARFDGEDVTTSSLLGTVVGNPQWLQLNRGSNNFGVGGYTEGLLWVLEYNNMYGGL